MILQVAVVSWFTPRTNTVSQVRRKPKAPDYSKQIAESRKALLKFYTHVAAAKGRAKPSSPPALSCASALDSCWITIYTKLFFPRWKWSDSFKSIDPRTEDGYGVLLISSFEVLDRCLFSLDIALHLDCDL